MCVYFWRESLCARSSTVCVRIARLNLNIKARVFDQKTFRTLKVVTFLNLKLKFKMLLYSPDSGSKERKDFQIKASYYLSSFLLQFNNSTI